MQPRANKDADIDSLAKVVNIQFLLDNRDFDRFDEGSE